MKRRLIFLILFLIGSFRLFGQILNDEPTFDSIKKQFYNFTVGKNDTSFDGGNTQYKRFVSEMDYKFNKSSKISDYVNAVHNFNNSISNNSISTANSALISDWFNIGPNKDLISSIGRVTAIWVNPQSPYNVIIGTRSSGIWKTKGGYVNPVWECITPNMKACGISSIAVATDTNVIYASTSFSGSLVSFYGGGLIKSYDGGSTWQREQDSEFPVGFLGNSGSNGKRFTIPLAFKPNSYELLIGCEKKVWKKHCEENNQYWDLLAKSDLSALSSSLIITSIQFNDDNPNIAIFKGDFDTHLFTKYTLDGGNIWKNFTYNTSANYFNKPSGATDFECLISSTFYNNDIYLLIATKYSVNSNKTLKGRLIRFAQDVNGNFVETSNKWDINNFNSDTEEPIFKGILGEMVISYNNISQKYECIYGQTQGVIKKGIFDNNISEISFYSFSYYLPSTGDGDTHADIRDIYQLKSNSINTSPIFIATDGGVSMANSLPTYAYDWTNINGIGLTISESLGFNNSEFDKFYYAFGGYDGNSWIRKRQNGNLIFTQDTKSISIIKTLPADAFDVTISKKYDIDQKNIVATINGSGYDFSILNYDYRPGNYGGYLPPSSIDTKYENNYFQRQNDFDFDGGLYSTTSDVFYYPKYFETTNQSHAPSWTNKSTTDYFESNNTSPIKTRGAISAFRFFEDANGITHSIYTMKGVVDVNEFSDTKSRVISVKYDPNSATADLKYIRTDITPFNVYNSNRDLVPNNTVYETWAQDIEYNDNNPEEVWIAFGGLRGLNGIGRVFKRQYDINTNSYQWFDFSNGLPDFPVLCLVYWKGSDDIIFAGTDVGVYYYDKLNNTWTPFMNSFPYSTVNDLEINYCSNSLRASTSGRGIWETTLPDIGFDNELPIEITSNQLWNTTRDTYKNVLIKSGATLTIEGNHNSNDNTNSVEIRIPKERQIMVEPGGKLIISGATITNHCDLWDGIRVIGQKSSFQTDENQGRIILKNGAIIENARTGISTSKVYDWGWDQNTTGGIITCYNSTFRNNRRDVELLSYHRIPDHKTSELPYRAVFSKCKFITDNDYLFENQTPVHITMWDVNGVNIVGSEFIDSRESPIGGIGIYTISSGFNINEFCAVTDEIPVASKPACNGDESKFTNLNYGVYSFGQSNPKYSVNIGNTIFEKCNRAIYLNGVDYASVFLNTINVIKKQSQIEDQSSLERYGIYLDMCKSYKIEENGVMGDINSNNTSSFGIVARNMHGENTRIYKNRLVNLTIGIEAIGRNKSSTLEKGLQIICNDFSDSKFDIYVTNDPDIPVQNNIRGIARSQGFPDPLNPGKLAGNLFGNSSTHLIGNFINEGGFINYYHHSPTNKNRLKPHIYSDVTKIGLINTNTPYIIEEACLTSFTNIFTAEQLRSSVITKKFQMEENIAALSELLDAGNTEEFLLGLDLSNENFINSNYFLLMNVSPFLSKSVLLKVVANECAFSNAMIRNVLVACSQAAKDDEIQMFLDNRSNQLPIYMREQINLGLIEMSALEVEEKIIGSYKSEIDQSIIETMWRATQDTLDLSNSIFNIFNEIEDPSLKLQEIQWLDASGRENQSNDLLSQLASNISEEDQENFNIFSTMRLKCFDYSINNVDILNLNPEEILNLESMISIPVSSVAPAMALLKLNNMLVYNEPLLIPQTNSNRVVKIGSNQLIQELDPSESSLNISPNPVKDLFIAKYKVLEKCSNLKLVINDNIGNEVLMRKLENRIDEIIIDCGSMITGNYIVTLKADGIKPISQKIVITKN